MYGDIMVGLVETLKLVKRGNSCVTDKPTINGIRKALMFDAPRLSAMNCEVELSESQMRNQLQLISEPYGRLEKSMIQCTEQEGYSLGDSHEKLEKAVEEIQIFLSTIVQSSEVGPWEC